MAVYIDLLRYRTEKEEQTERRWPSVHGEMAYKQRTGMIAKMMPGKLVDEGNGHDEGETRRHALRMPNYLTRKEAAELLQATFGRVSGCGHSYDCCGCASYHVTGVRRIARGQFSMLLRKSYNY